MRTRISALIVCTTLGMTGVYARKSQVSVLTASPFESYLESLRAQAGIPGMSAALVQNGQIVWERGFGFQNQESRLPTSVRRLRRCWSCSAPNSDA